MQRVTELSLPELIIEDLAFSKDPAPRVAAARQQHPWLAKSATGYVVTDYTAMKELLSMDDSMKGPYDLVVQIMKAQDTHWGHFQKTSIVARVGDDHQRMRNVVAAAFTPRVANQQRKLMRDVVIRLLDEWAPRGRFDFEEFASYFPISVMCNLLGADAAVVPRLRTSMEALGLSASMQPSILPDLERAMLVMEEYVAELIAGRLKGQRLHDTPDLLDALIAARDTGGISDAELHNLLIFLFVAGYDTSKNMLTLMMHEFLTRPDLYQRCAEDFTYCTKVVEESLRFHSPANTARMTYREFEYRDVAFPKDIMLYFPNGVIGRDPKIFENPDDIDPERENANRHIAFGSGVYMCLGQHIARAQIQEGIHLIAQRLKNPKLAGPVSHRPFPGVWGLKGLPIEFTTASARAAQSLN